MTPWWGTALNTDMGTEPAVWKKVHCSRPEVSGGMTSERAESFTATMNASACRGKAPMSAVGSPPTSRLSVSAEASVRL